MRTVLLAGATGTLGRHVARELVARGYEVRRLVRRDPSAGDWVADLRWAQGLQGAFRNVQAVVSCAGAAMRLGNWGDRAGFSEVDWEGNRNLIDAAAKAGVGKFVYVSLANGPALVRTEYAAAHEKTVVALGRSGMEYAVVRPTGLYAFFLEILRMAQKGHGVVLGDGSALTNPIHEADAARACVEALNPGTALNIPVGGPDVYTRREIVELAFRSAGKAPSVRCVPPWAFAPVPPLVRMVNRRIAALIEFGTAVSQADCLAPAYGHQRLKDYFHSAVSGKPSGASSAVVSFR